ncbi:MULTISPECIES: hypothetical protein [Brucella/Ochrobactrum group]|uniref:Uncharacterized protein n=1 Tax=Ochrobactrum teleogrylli TaxID=2479765 RepID=A0ABD5K4V0_9HYPH|nr:MULTISPECIES: hypothetical protein [Brucella/Ochrobactrum group]MBA8845754.1 hypothetical protein [Ochrobactrum sp. RH1CCR137]MBA8857475.1 hypothetical protein [Ochrobactrum sp. RH1CCR134]UXO86256.1 hypothetical protein N8I72_21960 [Brucella intermedia]
MAVTLLHGTGNLICDGVDVGGVEFSIASPADGPDVIRRGKVWGNKKAVGAALNATKTELAVPEFGGFLLLDIQDLDRDGGALFTVLQPATV